MFLCVKANSCVQQLPLDDIVSVCIVIPGGGRRQKLGLGRRSNGSNTFFMLLFSPSQGTEQPTAQHTDVSNTTYIGIKTNMLKEEERESRFVMCMDRRPCDMMRSWSFLVD